MSADYLKGTIISILHTQSNLILMKTLSGGYYWSFYMSGNSLEERREGKGTVQEGQQLASETQAHRLPWIFVPFHTAELPEKSSSWGFDANQLLNKTQNWNVVTSLLLPPRIRNLFCKSEDRTKDKLPTKPPLLKRHSHVYCGN